MAGLAGTFCGLGKIQPEWQSSPTRGPDHPGRSGALPFAAIRHHNPAVGSVVAGTCRGDAAPPVLSAVPCAPPPVPSAQSCAVRFVAAVNPFIIKTTGWHAVFAACRAWLRFCRMALHRFITQTAVFSFLHQGMHLAFMPKGSQIGKNSVFSVAPHGLENRASCRFSCSGREPSGCFRAQADAWADPASVGATLHFQGYLHDGLFDRSQPANRQTPETG